MPETIIKLTSFITEEPVIPLPWLLHRQLISIENLIIIKIVHIIGYILFGQRRVKSRVLQNALKGSWSFLVQFLYFVLVLELYRVQVHAAFLVVLFLVAY